MGRKSADGFWRSPGIILLTLMLVSCNQATDPVALGTLERDRITLRATMSEVIREQPLREGSQVSAGELLVQLDSRQQQDRVAELQARLSAAGIGLERLHNGFRSEEIEAARARVAAAQAALRESQREVERLQTVVERDLAARADMETAEARRDNRQALLEEAQAQLQLMLNGVREEDIRQAEAEVMVTEAALARALKVLDELAIVAPRDGRVEQLPWEVGERVVAGTAVAVMLVGDAPYARVYIPEPYRMQIDIGTRLPVELDGMEGALEGEVRWIARDPAFTPYFALNREERSRLMYLAEIQLPASAADLPAGLPAQVRLPQ